jgi:hypothetical protein
MQWLHITSNGVVVFSEAALLDKNYTLLEHFSEGMWAHGHVFVPFSLRRDQPEVYGKYLYVWTPAQQWPLGIQPTNGIVRPAP